MSQHPIDALAPPPLSQSARATTRPASSPKEVDEDYEPHFFAQTLKTHGVKFHRSGRVVKKSPTTH